MTAGYQSGRPAQSGTAANRGGRGHSIRYPLCVFSVADDWIRHRDLAARIAPEVFHRRHPLESRGCRESRVPSAPAVMRKNAHDRPQVRRNTRPSLRSGFNGLWRAPRRRIRLASVTGELTMCRSGWIERVFAGLTPATGARTTRFCRPQLPSRGVPTGLMCCRPKFPATAFKRRSSARRHRSQAETRPATTSRARRCRVHRNLPQRS